MQNAHEAIGSKYPPVNFPANVISRFWSKVDKKGKDECWIWKDRKTVYGYGQFNASPKMRRAHRVSFEMTFGKIPDGMLVCHKCDVRNCVNPSHLFIGTAKDNRVDAINKGRIPSGENHARSKLTDLDIIKIRLQSNSGKSQRAIGREFKISQSNVLSIVLRKTWKHVP